jgi:DNA mismatch repair protein MutS
MSFKVDSQTTADLNLFSRNEKTPSLFRFYNRTETKGGQELLHKIISTPFDDKEFLENRKAEIRSYYTLNQSLKFNRRQIDFVEYYLKNRRSPLKNNIIDATRDSIVNKLKNSNDYYIIREGIIYLATTLRTLKEFLINIHDVQLPETLTKNYGTVLEYLNHKTLSKFLDNIPDDFRKLKSNQINLLDNFFRASMKTELRTAMDTIYRIDVLQSHCRLLKEEHFCLPEYSQEDAPIFEVEDCVHPLINDPIPNSFKFNQDQSLCFLTGPNMSGKSTFLKTVGILIYFAHLGLPVPAKRLTIPVFNGLFTTINLSDSVSQGFSHFFAEVIRIKELSLELKENKNVVLILDELFRGTNVKDAFDGTLLVVSLLSKIKGTFFFISTHILEVAEHLADSQNIDFRCFESGLNQDKPLYDYKLKNGITSERVGMQIINNEGIEKILHEIIMKQP